MKHNAVDTNNASIRNCFYTLHPISVQGVISYCLKSWLQRSKGEEILLVIIKDPMIIKLYRREKLKSNMVTVTI